MSARPSGGSVRRAADQEAGTASREKLRITIQIRKPITRIGRRGTTTASTPARMTAPATSTPPAASIGARIKSPDGAQRRFGEPDWEEQQAEHQAYGQRHCPEHRLQHDRARAGRRRRTPPPPASPPQAGTPSPFRHTHAPVRGWMASPRSDDPDRVGVPWRPGNAPSWEGTAAAEARRASIDSQARTAQLQIERFAAFLPLGVAVGGWELSAPTAWDPPAAA